MKVCAKDIITVIQAIFRKQYIHVPRSMITLIVGTVMDRLSAMPYEAVLQSLTDHRATVAYSKYVRFIPKRIAAMYGYKNPNCVQSRYTEFTLLSDEELAALDLVYRQMQRVPPEQVQHAKAIRSAIRKARRSLTP